MMDDLTHLIRAKEKQLHDIHDERCEQLEKLIAERDQLLIESSKRFEQLRDDFQYNLALLEARDQEIERLEAHIHKVSSELNESHADRRALRGRIEVLETKEVERFEKHEEAKSANKRILQELKDVIEATRHAAAEEARAREREIEALKDDIQRVHQSRDESLETQRKDLTHTFEALLQQREDAFTGREKDIAAQVAGLESKFDVLQAENTRLKGENGDLHRRVEALMDETAAKEEHGRQLQQRVEEERAGRLQGEDHAQRRISQLTSDLSAMRERTIQDTSDMQRAADRLASELEREREFRAVAEKRVADLQSANQQEWGSLSHEIAAVRQAEVLTKTENQTLKEERDRYVEARAIARAEADAAEARCRALQADYDAMKNDVESLKNRTLEAELQFAKCDAALTEAKRTAVQSALESERRAAERMSTIDQSRATEVVRSREVALAEANERHHAVVSQYEARLAEVEIRYLETCAERDELRASVQRYAAAVEAERAESHALRGHLQMLERQAQDLQKRYVHVSEDRKRQEAFSMGLVMGAGYDTAPGGGPHPAASTTGAASAAASPYVTAATVPAPMPPFIDDFGQSGLPRPASAASFHHHHHQGGYAPTPHALGPSLSSGEYKYAGPAHAGREVDLSDENERLKAIINDMRADVDTMQTEILGKAFAAEADYRGEAAEEYGGVGADRVYHAHHAPSAPSAPSSSSGADRNEKRFEALEHRLEQTMGEVYRLRNERKRLMDVGNELRAAVNRQQQAPAPGSDPHHRHVHQSHHHPPSSYQQTPTAAAVAPSSVYTASRTTRR